VSATDDLIAELPEGRDHPVPARRLAALLGVPHRTVGQLVAEAIAAGYLIGSSCSADAPGYFLVRSGNRKDLEVGTAHIRARAFQSLARVRQLEKAAARSYGPEAMQLFSLDGVA
jgi:hypothetical protein